MILEVGTTVTVKISNVYSIKIQVVFFLGTYEVENPVPWNVLSAIQASKVCASVINP
jgi:hypothetical protein